MIKFENTEVMNFDGAIRGMRNPMNSWDKSDSYKCDKCMNEPVWPCECPLNNYSWLHVLNDDCYQYVIGPNDLDLMKRLIKAGSDHRKFLRQILVSVDITAPLYWWKEFDTYKVGTVANSCSTMHKIHTKEFTLKDFSCEHLSDTSLSVLKRVIEDLNFSRKAFIGEFEDIPKGQRSQWWDMIQLLPSSYNQKRTVTLNYEVLRNIRNSDRKTHKLDEWRVGFMNWIDSLPYAEELLKL